MISRVSVDGDDEWESYMDMNMDGNNGVMSGHNDGNGDAMPTIKKQGQQKQMPKDDGNDELQSKAIPSITSNNQSEPSNNNVEDDDSPRNQFVSSFNTSSNGNVSTDNGASSITTSSTTSMEAESEAVDGQQNQPLPPQQQRSTTRNRIPTEQIELIKSSISLVDVVESYNLPNFSRTNSGASAKANCPFHNDNNPSLSID
ncbi:hypothetical protein ACHAXR_000226, partial [Thalassiosira sp. AJA248-18]